MKYQAAIDVMPLKELLDPQGKAVENSMGNLQLPEISNVRIGKHITLVVDAADEATARTKVEDACQKLLVNRVIEFYEYELEAVSN